MPGAAPVRISQFCTNNSKKQIALGTAILFMTLDDNVAINILRYVK
jgi:hypothetical protein